MFSRPTLTALATAAVLAAGAGSAHAATGVSVTEGDTSNAFAEVVVTTASSLTTSFVNWSTSDGTAKDGVDYGGQQNGLIFMQPLQTSQSIFIPIQPDLLHEGDETFDVNFTGTTMTSPATQTVTIVDNDAAPEAKIGDVTVHEADGTASFPVAISRPSALPASVEWSTADDSAKAGSDYTAAGGRLTFAPGETAKTVTVPIVDDAAHEGDERFTVRLANPSEASIAVASATATILDEDPAPAAPAALAPADTQSRGEVHVGPGVSIAEPRVRYRGLDRKRHGVRLQLTCPKTAELPRRVEPRWGGKKVGGASYLLAKGASRTLRVKLSPKAWRSLSRRHRLRLVAALDSGRTCASP